MNFRRVVSAIQLTVLLLAPIGCVTFSKSTHESPIEVEHVEALEVGQTTLPEALELLGSPLEIHLHTDGRILVYRFAKQESYNLQVGISQALRLIDLTRVTSELLSNLSFTYESIDSNEDRLALLFDHQRVLKGVGVSWGVGGADD